MKSHHHRCCHSDAKNVEYTAAMANLWVSGRLKVNQDSPHFGIMTIVTEGWLENPQSETDLSRLLTLLHLRMQQIMSRYQSETL